MEVRSQERDGEGHEGRRIVDMEEEVKRKEIGEEKTKIVKRRARVV